MVDSLSGHGGRRSHGSSESSGGKCKIFLEIAKWIPVLFIFLVISWSYFAFAIQLCILTLTDVWLQIFTLIIYHIVLFLFLWSYWQTIFTNSRRVPKKFRISTAEMDRVDHASSEAEINNVLDTIVRTNNLPVQTRTNINQIRFCEKCYIIKPDRCHHCSVCGSCILKMDHHCPWVNNCVCFDNYKFFVLFLGYAFLYCVTIVLFSLSYFIDFWTRDWNSGPLGAKFHILFVFFVAAMFALSLVSLFSYHLYLISKNRSTLESFRLPIFSNGPDALGFSLGSYYNFIEVFGDRKILWFLPVFSSLGDGLSFPTQHSTTMNNYSGGNYNSIDTTDSTPGSSGSPDGNQCIEVRVESSKSFVNHEAIDLQYNGNHSNKELNGNTNANFESNQQSESSLVNF